MGYLVRTGAGIDHFATRHRLALVPTEEYVAAVKGAGLDAEVLVNYLPGRDRIVGVRSA